MGRHFFHVNVFKKRILFQFFTNFAVQISINFLFDSINGDPARVGLAFLASECKVQFFD